MASVYSYQVKSIDIATTAPYESVLSKLEGTNIVGINANKISDIQDALRAYRDNVNKKVRDLADQNVSNAAMACGEENKAVVEKYVNKIIDHIITYLNSFEGFDDKLSLVREAYEKASGNAFEANKSIKDTKISIGNDGRVFDYGNKVTDGINAYNNNPYVKNVAISKELAAILPPGVTTTEQINEFLADEVIKGNLGRGEARSNRYKELGVNGEEIQNIVNKKLNNTYENKREDGVKEFNYGTKEYTYDERHFAPNYGNHYHDEYKYLSENIKNHATITKLPENSLIIDKETGAIGISEDVVSKNGNTMAFYMPEKWPELQKLFPDAKPGEIINFKSAVEDTRGTNVLVTADENGNKLFSYEIQ